MTVAELIVALQAMPQDMDTMTEGCDCFGEPNGVEVFDGEFVLITRKPA